MSAIWLSLLLAAGPADAKLLGQWTLYNQPFMALESGGKGVMEGERFSWTVEGNTLKITSDGETEQMSFKLDGDQLTISLDGNAILLTRAAKMAGQSSPPMKSSPSAPSPTNEGAPDLKDPLSQLLLSSAWCSFSYSNGTTRTSKVVYANNGTWSSGSNRETQWSGQNGSLYGQNGGADGGRWSVKQSQLYMSSPETPQLTLVPLTVTRNSNGYPIITAAGKEYSQCN